MRILNFYDGTGLQVPESLLKKEKAVVSLCNASFSDEQLEGHIATYKRGLPAAVTAAKWLALLFGACGLVLDFDADLMMLAYVMLAGALLGATYLMQEFLRNTRQLTKKQYSDVMALLGPSRERAAGQFIQRYLATIEKNDRTMRVYDVNILKVLVTMAQQHERAVRLQAEPKQHQNGEQ